MSIGSSWSQSDFFSQINPGFAEAAICEALKEPIDRSGLYMVARPIYQPLCGFSDGGKFGGVITLYSVRCITAEGSQIQHEPTRRGSISVRRAMLLPNVRERRAPGQQIT